MVTVAVDLKDFSITEDVLEKNINYAWEEKYKSYGYSDTEKTALILNNLYDVIVKDAKILSLVYNKLIDLNSQNQSIVHRLASKKEDLLANY